MSSIRNSQLAASNYVIIYESYKMSHLFNVKLKSFDLEK